MVKLEVYFEFLEENVHGDVLDDDAVVVCEHDDDGDRVHAC